MAFYLVYEKPEVQGDEKFIVKKRDTIDEIFAIIAEPKYRDINWTIFYKDDDGRAIAIDDASLHKIKPYNIFVLIAVILIIFFLIALVVSLLYFK